MSGGGHYEIHGNDDVADALAREAVSYGSLIMPALTFQTWYLSEGPSIRMFFMVSYV